MDKIKAFIKRTKSYFKKNWNFEDYPTKTWKNPNAGERKVAYGAGIIDWTMMIGHGETPEKALAALKDKFIYYKDNNNNLPRPGTNVPMMFISTDKIDLYEKTAVDFFKNVLDMDYYNGFYSDGSSLFDFEMSLDFELSDNDDLVKKFREKTIKQTLLLYNVDITDIYNEPFWKIFERIEIKNKM